MILPYHHRAGIIAHARREAPAECCGILAGSGGRVHRTYRLTNVAASPRNRYLADPQQQLAAFQDMERRGWDLVGIYHSHPASRACPSETDLSLAYYPEARYVIVSLAEKSPSIRCFTIAQGQIAEERLLDR